MSETLPTLVSGTAPPRAGLWSRLAGRIDLKTRLSLFIALLLGAVLALAVLVVLGNARRAVEGEIDAVMRLAGELVDEAAPAGSGVATAMPGLLDVLDRTRHLCVEVDAAQLTPRASGCPAPVDDEVPQWFSRRVTVPPKALRRVLLDAEGRPQPVVIRSDPADEIFEAWRAARPLLLLIVAIGFLTNAIVVVTVWRAFRPIELIREALARIGRGEAHPGLPRATTPELRRLIDGVIELGSNLEHLKSDNRRLLRHSLEVQERERRSIARELHDEIGQSLVAMDADLALLQQRGQPRPELLQQTLVARAGIAKLYDGLHGLLARLRPAGLDEFGLGPALQSLVADWAARCPQIRFEANVEVERVRGEALVQVYLYRIAQEALTNAARHSGASEIRLRLMNDSDGATHLQIADNGCGLNHADRPRGARAGLGLLGMKERADTLGADLAIDSAATGGTRISVCLPVEGPVEVPGTPD